jgi:Ca2+-binding EF-hand superfamily protein
MKIIIALVVFISVVTAEEKAIEKDLHKLFDAVNKNKDGKLTEKEFLDYFKEFDKDNNGLTKEEFKKAIAVAPELEETLWNGLDKNKDGKVSQEEVKQRFHKFDTSKDGSVDFNEILEAVALAQIFHKISGGKDELTKAQWEDFFKKADKGDKGLTEAELIEALKDFPETAVKKLFKELDDQKDGKVTKKEIEDNFKAFNADGNDKLTIGEFKTGVQYGLPGQIFRRLDTSKNGKLTGKEIFEALNKDKNDKVTLKEVQGALKGIKEADEKKLYALLNADNSADGITVAEAEKFVKDNDKKEPKDDSLSFSEFLAAWNKK